MLFSSHGVWFLIAALFFFPVFSPQHADAIAVMEAGRVVELGPHSQLMQIKDGIYKSLVDMQSLATGTGCAWAPKFTCFALSFLYALTMALERVVVCVRAIGTQIEILSRLTYFNSKHPLLCPCCRLRPVAAGRHTHEQRQFRRCRARP